jgi:predicted AAA+ superfamily ATPase
VVFDEVQRRPDLFPILRVLADRPELPARFLVLGSAGPDLLRQTSESLAGRIFYHELEGLALDEVGVDALGQLWLRGGLPRSFLAGSDADSNEWRQGFIRTFLERDLVELGIRIPSLTLRRFWTMIAHYHGQVWNGSEFARAFGVAGTTVARYLDILSAALVVRQLPPWYENLQKRQVRSPKVYIADSGVLHSLLNLGTRFDLEGHVKVGASWEGFGIAEVANRLGARAEECFFWATHAGAELDLLVVRGRRRLGFEFKYSDAPRPTRSMYSALADLQLDRLDVVHAGEHTYPLAEGIRALALSRLWTDLEPLAQG